MYTFTLKLKKCPIADNPYNYELSRLWPKSYQLVER